MFAWIDMSVDLIQIVQCTQVYLVFLYYNSLSALTVQPMSDLRVPVDTVPALQLFKQGPIVAPPSLTFQTDVHLSSITGGLKRLATFTLGFSEYIYSNHFGIIENLQAKPHQCKFHIQAESSQKLPIMGPFKCSIKRRTGRIMSASEPASTPAAQEPRQKSIKASRQEPNPTG